MCHIIIKLFYLFLAVNVFTRFKESINIVLFFFSRSLLEYNCVTIPCQFLLYTKVNQPYAYICPHIPSLLSLPPILPIPPLQVITKHRSDLPVLCCCFPLANYFTFGSVYMSMLLSLRSTLQFLYLKIHFGHMYICIIYTFLHTNIHTHTCIHTH